MESRRNSPEGALCYGQWRIDGSTLLTNKGYAKCLKSIGSVSEWREENLIIEFNDSLITITSADSKLKLDFEYEYSEGLGHEFLKLKLISGNESLKVGLMRKQNK
jgi:hypothetical protein